jgi:hypothetical protein
MYTANTQPPTGKQLTWTFAAIALAGSIYFAWTAVVAMRTGFISVKKTFLAFTWWDEVNSDDNPLQFWFAVFTHWIASAACIFGLVLVLKWGIS